MTTSGSSRCRWRKIRARGAQNLVHPPQFSVLDRQPLILREHVRTRPVLAFATVGSSWRTRLELDNAIFEYLEIWHNRQRRHSRPDMHTPVEYERRRLTVA